MATRIPTNVRNAMANAAVDLIDAGPAAGAVQIRTGAQPASAGSAATGTLLGTLTLSDPAFADAVNGTATAGAVTGDSSADASGTAGWFRVLDSTGATVMDGAISEAGGGGDMILDSTAIVAGGTISVTSWTVTQPAG
ncbi:hypothetical protein [uncultured Microbacterium sp.]|uniref:hypothetical protein n=1 Tax=uncultured Microbacterium sp. TaxID=191216 RepID=UPI0025CFD6A5|nr:hypothetical protein [uncultured Microbacterium sp.]